MADIPSLQGSSIQVPTTDTGTASTLSLITMARRGMRAAHTQTDREVLQVALEAVSDCVNDINVRNTLDFTITKDTDLPLVENQREYSIPDGAFALKEVVLIKDSEDPEEIHPLGYIDWDQLQRFFVQKDTGRPVYWSARDVFFDRKIQLVRPPDANSASEFKLRIYYHTAIENPPLNDWTVSINAPTLISTGIIRYVEYRVRAIFGEPNDPRRQEAYREYRDFIRAIRGMENRSRPGGPQIRLTGVQQGATGFWSRRVGPMWK